MLLRLREHVSRLVQTDRAAGPQMPVQMSRQLAAPAAQVDYPHRFARLNQRQQIIKRLGALARELAILLRVPSVVHVVSLRPHAEPRLDGLDAVQDLLEKI